MIQAVIFDFDGVLVDSEPANVAAAVRTFREFGHPLSGAQQERIPGRSSKDFIPEFLRDFGLPPELFENLYAQNRETYFSLWDTDVVQPMPFACETVGVLHERGIALSIATSNHRMSVQKFISRFRLDNIFAHILTGEDVANRKPHPEIYQTMARKLQLPVEYIIAVEDTERGLISAKDAELRCAVIPNVFSRHHDFSRADYVLSSLRDLHAVVFAE